MKKLTLLLFLFISSLSCRQTQTKDETVTVDNGVEIPIKACVEANKKILGNSVEPVALCKCLIPKLYADLINDPENLKLLKEGKWDELSKEK